MFDYCSQRMKYCRLTQRQYCTCASACQSKPLDSSSIRWSCANGRSSASHGCERREPDHSFDMSPSCACRADAADSKTGKSAPLAKMPKHHSAFRNESKVIIRSTTSLAADCSRVSSNSLCTWSCVWHWLRGACCWIAYMKPTDYEHHRNKSRMCQNPDRTTETWNLKPEPDDYTGTGKI